MVGARRRARAQHRHALARTGSRRCSPPAGRRTQRGVPVVLDPVGAGATAYRTETARRILDEVDVAVLRGNAGEVATLVGVAAEVRGVESVGGGADAAELAREAARSLGVVASVTGAGRPRLRRRAGRGDRERRPDARDDHGYRLHVERRHRLLPRGRRARRSTPRSRRSSPSASPARTRRARRKGPGSFHVNLYDALAALDPATLDARARVT